MLRHVRGRAAAADGCPMALMAPLCIASSHTPHFPIRIVAVRERVEWEDKDGDKGGDPIAQHGLETCTSGLASQPPPHCWELLSPEMVRGVGGLG